MKLWAVLTLSLFSESILSEALRKKDKSKKKEAQDFGTVIGIDLGTTYSW